MLSIRLKKKIKNNSGYNNIVIKMLRILDIKKGTKCSVRAARLKKAFTTT